MKGALPHPSSNPLPSTPLSTLTLLSAPPPVSNLNPHPPQRPRPPTPLPNARFRSKSPTYYLFYCVLVTSGACRKNKTKRLSSVGDDKLIGGRGQGCNKSLQLLNLFEVGYQFAINAINRSSLLFIVLTASTSQDSVSIYI